MKMTYMNENENDNCMKQERQHRAIGSEVDANLKLTNSLTLGWKEGKTKIFSLSYNYLP